MAPPAHRAPAYRLPSARTQHGFRGAGHVGAGYGARAGPRERRRCAFPRPGERGSERASERAGAGPELLQSESRWRRPARAEVAEFPWLLGRRCGEFRGARASPRPRTTHPGSRRAPFRRPGDTLSGSPCSGTGAQRRLPRTPQPRRQTDGRTDGRTLGPSRAPAPGPGDARPPAGFLGCPGRSPTPQARPGPAQTPPDHARPRRVAPKEHPRLQGCKVALVPVPVATSTSRVARTPNPAQDLRRLLCSAPGVSSRLGSAPRTPEAPPMPWMLPPGTPCATRALPLSAAPGAPGAAGGGGGGGGGGDGARPGSAPRARPASLMPAGDA